MDNAPLPALSTAVEAGTGVYAFSASNYVFSVP